MRRRILASATALILSAQSPPPSALGISVRSADGRSAPAAGKAAEIILSARDPATGFPLDGMRAALWVVPDDGTSCAEWFTRLSGNPITPDGVVPLTGYDVIQATDSGHIAVLDPLLNLASANIRSVRPVPGPIQGWAVGEDGDRLAMIAGPGRTVQLLDIDGQARPRDLAGTGGTFSLAAGPDGFWLGMADGRLIATGPDGATRRSLTVSAAPVLVAMRPGGGVIALGTDGKGALIDRNGQTRSIDLGHPVTAIADAPLANSLFALTGQAQMVRLSYDAPDVAVPIATDTPYRRIAADPEGRWLALLPDDGGHIAIFDTERMRVRWTIDAPDPVVELLFSDMYLYLQHRGRGGVTRVNFDPASGAPGLAAIAAGTGGDVPQTAGALPHMLRIPGEGILVTSSRERRAYMVSDSGAQAAMSALPLRAGTSQGIALRVRGFRPAGAKGQYVARFVPAEGGRLLAVVQTDRPQLLHCSAFDVAGSVAGTPRAKAAAVATAPATPTITILPGDDPGQLRLRLSDTSVIVVRAMLIDRQGMHQQLSDMRRDGDDRIFRLDRPIAGDQLLYVEIQRRSGTRETLVHRIQGGAAPTSGQP